MTDVHVAMRATVWGSGGMLPCLNFFFFFFLLFFGGGEVDILGVDLLAVDILRPTQQELVRVAQNRSKGERVQLAG